MAEIDREQLLKVAHLARLELREDEVERLGQQLNDILAAVSKSRSSISPTCRRRRIRSRSSTSGTRTSRATSLPVDEALANAPEREGGFFKVPPGGAA